jgi:hypothetical protein
MIVMNLDVESAVHAPFEPIFEFEGVRTYPGSMCEEVVVQICYINHHVLLYTLLQRRQSPSKHGPSKHSSKYVYQYVGGMHFDLELALISRTIHIICPILGSSESQNGNIRCNHHHRKGDRPIHSSL